VLAALPFVAAHHGATVSDLSAAPPFAAGPQFVAFTTSGATSGRQGSPATSGGNGAAGAGSGGGESGGGKASSPPQGPAIKSADINSGSHAGIGWTFAVLVLVALAALGFPFFVSALKQRRSEVAAGGAMASQAVQAPPPAVSPTPDPGGAGASHGPADWIPAGMARRAPEIARPASELAPPATETAPPATETSPPATETPAPPAPASTPAAPVARDASGPPSQVRRRGGLLHDRRSHAAIVAAAVGGSLQLALRSWLARRRR
jgi:hypothetical protein